jgi:phosphatidylcholine synthase
MHSPDHARDLDLPHHDGDDELPCEGRVWRALLVHAVTASGVIVGFLGLLAVIEGHARSAILLLIAAQVLDGIDGPMARAWQISKLYPKLDGYLLDLVVDYVTCVVVPVAFLYEFELLPSPLATPICALVLFTSALWFSRTDMMTDDHWFRGFPATWNLVAPSVFLLGTGTVTNAVVITALALLQLTDVPFAHPVQVVERRIANLAVTVVWVVGMAAAAVLHPDTHVIVRLALVGAPLWTFATTAEKWLAIRHDRPVLAEALVDDHRR